MRDDLLADAALIHERLSAGFGPGPNAGGSIDSLVAELNAAGSDVTIAWALLLTAQSKLLGGELSDSSPADIRRWVNADEPVREVACQLLRCQERTALLAFDLAGFRSWLELHETMARGLSSPRTELSLRLARSWLGWLEGRSLADAAAEIGRAARQAQVSALVVEAQALEALHRLSAGELEDATASARRASRMARAEGIPDSEVLANVVLARVRRLQDRPHLTLRILGGLAPHAPRVWRDWIAWEAVLSGALSIRGLEAQSLAGFVVALAAAAQQGRPDPTQRAAAALLAATEHVHPLRADASDAVSLLCPEHRETSDAMAAWRRGDTAELPAGVTGLAFAGALEATDDSNCARVLAVRSGAAERVIALASPLAVALVNADARPAEGPTRPRTDSGLAALALAGGSMSVPDYFQHVYGYKFDSAKHSAVLTMHTHRMRERLGESAELERENARFQLAPRQALLLRDPRCEEPLAHRVLRSIASAGRRSATELAQELDVPLRTMQRTLKELHVGDDLVQVKSGRTVVYEVEDTTFSEPTRSRLFGDALIVSDPSGPPT